MDEAGNMDLKRWVRRRDPEAFAAIVARYSGMVYATCLRVLGNAHDAEEASQECFEKLAQAEVSAVAHLGPWLHRVATNLSINRARAERRRRERETRYAEEARPQAEASWDDVYREVDEAVSALPENLRVPVVAHFLEGQTHAQIAAELRLSRPAVTQRIGRGVARVARQLRKRGIVVPTAVLAALLEERWAEAAAVPATLTAKLGKLALAQGPRGAVTASALGGLATVGKAAALLIGLAGLAAGWWLWKPSMTPQAPVENRPTPAAVTPATAQEGAASVPAANEKVQPVPLPTAGEGGVVTGVVRDETGAPVAGATVIVEPVEWVWRPVRPETGSKRGLSDGAGRFALTGLEPLSLNVFATVDDGFGWAVASLTERKPVDDVVVDMKPTVQLTGRVVDSRGRGVAGARLWPEAWWWNGQRQDLLGNESQGMQAASTNDGAFRCAHLWPGEWQFRVEAPGYAPVVTEAFAAPGGPVEVTLQNGATAAGRVVDTSGRPVAGVKVILRSPLSVSEPQSVTEATGAFRFEHLADRSYPVHVDDASWASMDPELQFEIRDGRNVEGLVVPVVAGGVLAGRVYAAGTGTGIAEMEVRASGPVRREGRTAPDGSYRFTGLPEGEYFITHTRKSGFSSGHDEFSRGLPVRLEAGEAREDVDLGLEPLPAVMGRVVDSEGQPVPFATVEGCDAEGRPQLHGTCDAAGAFTAHAEKPGARYWLWAVCPGKGGEQGWASKPQGPLLVPESGLNDVALTVGPEARVLGTVVDEAGQPVGEAWVSAKPVEAGLPPRLVTLIRGNEQRSNTAGRFEVAGLFPGRYELSARPQNAAPDYTPSAPLRVRLHEGETAAGCKVVVRRGSSATLAGTVTWSGSPPSYGEVLVHREGSWYRAAEVGKDGRFEKPWLSAGETEVRVAARVLDGELMHTATWSRIVALAPGQTTRLEVDLAPGNAALEGRVVDGEQPRVGARVEVRMESMEGGELVHEIQANAEGYYRFDGLPGGTATVSLDPHGRVQQVVLRGGAAERRDFDLAE